MPSRRRKAANIVLSIATASQETAHAFGHRALGINDRDPLPWLWVEYFDVFGLSLFWQSVRLSQALFALWNDNGSRGGFSHNLSLTTNLKTDRRISKCQTKLQLMKRSRNISQVLT